MTRKRTHTVRVIDGPGSELIMLSLHCLLRHEKPPIAIFRIGTESLPLVITEIGTIECIEGVFISTKGACEKDVSWFCPQRQSEREEREFVFTNYNHHTRKGFVQIPPAYLAYFEEMLALR